MIDFLLTAILVLVVGGASLFIYKEKKNGVKCVGCPNAKNCAKMHCSCHGEKN